MKTNDKKIEKSIVKALHRVCETLKLESNGFCWLTHFVDYANFTQSLKIVYVFETSQYAKSAQAEAAAKSLLELADTQLKNGGIFIPSIKKSVFFDSEENGADVNSAHWCRKYSRV